MGVSWFAFVGGQIIAGGKLLQVTAGMDLSVAIFVAGAVILTYTAMGGLKAVIFALRQFDTDIRLAETAYRDAGSFEFEAAFED